MDPEPDMEGEIKARSFSDANNELTHINKLESINMQLDAITLGVQLISEDEIKTSLRCKIRSKDLPITVKIEWKCIISLFWVKQL